MADDRKWALGWAKFDALHKNLPNYVSEEHVRDYHAILDILQEATGEDLAPFRILDSRVAPRLTSFNYVTGKKNYSSARYCERDHFLSQMESVRGYFDNLQPPPQKGKVGF